MVHTASMKSAVPLVYNKYSGLQTFVVYYCCLSQQVFQVRNLRVGLKVQLVFLFVGSEPKINVNV